MATCQNRRDFIGMAFGGVAAVGGAFALGAMKKTWDPLPSVQSAGFVRVDVSAIQEGEVKTLQWRGKPVFILCKSEQMARNSARDILIGDKVFTLVIIQVPYHHGSRSPPQNPKAPGNPSPDPRSLPHPL